MRGWRYEWVQQLPSDVYEVIVEEMSRQQSDDSAGDLSDLIE